MEFKAVKAVDKLLPGCGLTRQTRNLTVHLRLFLNIKNVDYYVFQSLMIIMSFNDVTLEEAILTEEFGYRMISQARADFRRLMLTRMKKEAREIQVDLKPFDLEEAALYNAAVLADEDGYFSPISVGSIIMHTVSSPPQDQPETEQGDDHTIKLTLHEIEQIIVNHSRELLSDFRKEVETISKKFNSKLQLKGEAIEKVGRTSRPHSKPATDDRFTKKIEDVEGKVVTEDVNSANELFVTAASK